MLKITYSILGIASCREWEKFSPDETWKSIREPETLQGRSAGLQFGFCSHHRLRWSVPCSESSSLQQRLRPRGKRTSLWNLFIEFFCMLGTFFPLTSEPVHRVAYFIDCKFVIVEMYYVGLLQLVAYVQCPYIQPTWPNLSALSPYAVIRLLNVWMWACELTLIAYRDRCISLKTSWWKGSSCL